MLRQGIGAALLGLLVVAGCSQSLMMQGRAQMEERRYDAAIDAFYQEIAANPDNWRAWRELGVAFYEKGDLTKAEDALKQSAGMSQDARTQLYMGMIYEQRDDFSEAIKAYSLALGLDPDGDTEELLRARRETLIQRQIEHEIDEALAREEAIEVDTIPERTISVSTFDGSNLPPKLQPLAFGLAEFTASDLSKVSDLTVVERRRLEALLNELKLGQSGYVDPATAPRVGRLMGSRRLVTATIMNRGEEGVILDGAVVRSDDGTANRTEAIEGELEKVFEVQKQFVFEILDDLGIEVTAEERDEIREVPTESYLAFLAYSRGLDYEHRGMARAAKQEYAEAVRLDPGFHQADQRLAQTSAQLRGGPARADLGRFEGEIKKQHKRWLSRRGLGRQLSALAHGHGRIPAHIGDANPPRIVPPLSGGGTGVVVVKGVIDEE
jgi:tetratricopeptide (TPR) repeat protein